MAANLTNQVRSIAEVTTAVANGDLSKKVVVDVRGEMLDLKNTVNSMVSRLLVLANEVTRVSLEVGTEGILGGQAVVPGVEGMWKVLTDNVNLMVGRLGYLLTVRIADLVPGVELNYASAIDCRSHNRGCSRRLDEENQRRCARRDSRLEGDRQLYDRILERLCCRGHSCRQGGRYGRYPRWTGQCRQRWWYLEGGIVLQQSAKLN